MLALFFVAMAATAFSQTVTWTDSFVEGQAPTLEQCQNWTNFINQLGSKSFASVTISGTFDQAGRSITNPEDATKLAQMLFDKESGTVYSGEHYWTVGTCGLGACGSLSMTLSVDGNTMQCDCFDTYAIKAHSQTSAWGGVNTPSCNAPSQTMKLVFYSGVSITANGPTTFCEGDKVVLTASTDFCAGPYTYLWSNNATTESITVTTSGDYSVTVSGANNCSGVSAATTVSVSAISVNAGDDATFCADPVQLNAIGVSGGDPGETTGLCLFDYPGGTGNCQLVEDLCTEGAEFVTDQTYTATATGSVPSELTFLLYYSPFTDNTSFNFILNNQPLGTFQENNGTGTCQPGPFNQYPHSVSFSRSQLEGYWNDSGANTISVHVVATGMGVYLGAISAQVITSNESYSWAPSAGLSDASIANPIATPTDPTFYVVTYTGANGCTATDTVEVRVNCNTAPVAICKPVNAYVGENCKAVVEASAFDGGSKSNVGGELTFSVSPAGPYPFGKTDVTLTVTDANGASTTCTTTVTVSDAMLPVIAALEDINVTNDEGSCAATVALPNPEATDNCGIESIKNDQTDEIFDAEETLVTWTVTDINGNQQTATQKIIVTNSAPVINTVTASGSTVETNTPVALNVSYLDNNIRNAAIDWGDLSAPEILESPAADFSASHSYSKTGTYAVTVTLTDLCDATVAYVYESISVFEKRVGYVKGSGWFDSKQGYYLKDRRASGKAQFSFEAEYRSNSDVPVGNSSFRFKAGKLDFRSTEFALLLIDGQSAFLSGSGKLNKKAGYGILIAMYDEQKKNTDDDSFSSKKGKGDNKKVDRIRVRIQDPNGVVIYDTQLLAPDDAVASTEIGAGSIKIGSGNSTFMEGLQETIASYFGDESTSVSPNPFVDHVSIQFNSASVENINVQLMDLTGKAVFTAQYAVSEDGFYTMEIPGDELDPGIYILKISQSRRVEFIRLVRD